jgi:hypothetical protein
MRCRENLILDRLCVRSRTDIRCSREYSTLVHPARKTRYLLSILQRNPMSKNLTAAIAFGFAIALDKGVACAADSPVNAAPSDYGALRANCTTIAVAGRAQCVKDAKGKDNATVAIAKMKDTLWRCEDLTSREERACIVRELEGQHAETGHPGQVPTPLPR